MSDMSLESSGVYLPNLPLEHTRMRSRGESRPESEEEAVVGGNGQHTLQSRSGLLHSHNHSCLSSLNQSQIQGASFCPLPSSSHLSSSAKAQNRVNHMLGLERSSSAPHRVVHKASSTNI